ncbi:MAG: hypothetical protein MJK04_24160, partial [Psychrosphaera sp.]|nr:hypothetical protein [Psychrosphaera sp.]
KASVATKWATPPIKKYSEINKSGIRGIVCHSCYLTLVNQIIGSIASLFCLEENRSSWVAAL